jgi:hypothetical protein
MRNKHDPHCYSGKTVAELGTCSLAGHFEGAYQHVHSLVANKGQSIMHEYTVELRISGAELVPATVTQVLGVQPCSVFEVGERKAEGKVWNQALWGYNGFPSDTPNYWPSLEDGLTFLLDRLEPFRSQIDSYKQKYEVVWWCGHFQSSFDGGSTLSVKLMRRLADFGVKLYIDNYFDPPANAE